MRSARDLSKASLKCTIIPCFEGGSRYTHKSMIQSLPENLNRRSLSIVMGMREARPVRRPTGDSEGALDGD